MADIASVNEMLGDHASAESVGHQTDALKNRKSKSISLTKLATREETVVLHKDVRDLGQELVDIAENHAKLNTFKGNVS